jgi:DNA-binding transcriptional LysR family regulator
MHKNHPLAAEPGPIALSELDGIKIVTGPNTNSSMEHFWRYCAQSNVYPECVASVTNITGFVNKLKRDDVVVSLLSRLLPQINNPDIVIRKVVSPVLEGRCHCCFHKGAENAELLRGLMHQIKEYFKEEA